MTTKLCTLCLLNALDYTPHLILKDVEEVPMSECDNCKPKEQSDER